MKTNSLIDAIAIAVASHFNMKLTTLFEKTRVRHITDRRAIFHYLCHKHTNLSLVEIGMHATNFGRERFNHATVIHNIKKTKNLLQHDKNFAVDLMHLDAYVTKHIVVDKEKEALLNANVNLMMRRWFEFNEVDYLDCLSSVAEILATESDVEVLKEWIKKYEGVHKTTQADNRLGVVS